MTGNFIQVWEYLWLDLWGPLGDFSLNDESVPQDLFSVLFDTVNDYLSPRPSPQELGEIRNDPEKAQKRFQSLKGTDFTNEFSIVNFLEAAYDVIKDYEIPGFEEFYKQHLVNVIQKFNLRYRVDDPFVIRFLLPGSFTNLYSEIIRINAGNVDLSSLLNDFEKSFDRYARTQDPMDLKTCIKNAIIYAEGFASFTKGQPGGTLGALCNQLKVWPHDGVRDALKNLYRFCSDYPGIRHAGVQQNAHRSLAPLDAILACLLILSLSGYFSQQINDQVILGV